MRGNTEAVPIRASPVTSATFITPLALPVLGQYSAKSVGYVLDGGGRNQSNQKVLHHKRRQGRIRKQECFMTGSSCFPRGTLQETFRFQQPSSSLLSATLHNARRSTRLLAAIHPATTIDIIPSAIDSSRSSTTNTKPRKRTNASTATVSPPISVNPSSRKSTSSVRDSFRHLDTLKAVSTSLYTVSEQPALVSSSKREGVAANRIPSSETMSPIASSSLLIQGSVPNQSDHIPEAEPVKARAKPGRKPGSKLSEEHRQNIKKAMNQHFSSDNPAGIQTRRLQSQAKLGEKNPMFNKKHAHETLSLMSQKHGGQGNPNFGRTLSETTRNKISESMKQRWKMRREQEEKLNEEIRQKNELEENRRKYNQYRSVLKYRQSIM